MYWCLGNDKICEIIILSISMKLKSILGYEFAELISTSILGPVDRGDAINNQIWYYKIWKIEIKNESILKKTKNYTKINTNWNFYVTIGYYYHILAHIFSLSSELLSQGQSAYWWQILWVNSKQSRHWYACLVPNVRPPIDFMQMEHFIRLEIQFI